MHPPFLILCQPSLLFTLASSSHHRPKMKCSLIPILTCLLLFVVLPATPTAHAHWHSKENTVVKNFLYFPTYNATSGSQIPDDLNVAVLLEQDMKAGNKMKLSFAQSFEEAPFLPREVADSIPFSSAKLDDILNRFGVKPGSEDAEAMKQTLKDCEGAGIMGEEKYCATSLESMVAFARSKLGKKVEAMSTEVAAAVKERGTQEYTIAAGVEKVGDENVVVCHKMEYPYAVFYCHKFEKTTAHKVALEGTDGVRVKAVVVCHADTSHWNPEHLFLRLLNVKPGTDTVCHSLPQNNIVWVRKRLQNPFIVY